MKRCELSYRRCETSVQQMLRMIDTEIQELEMIQKELDNNAITISDIDNRYILFINFRISFIFIFKT